MSLSAKHGCFAEILLWCSAVIVYVAVGGLTPATAQPSQTATSVSNTQDLSTGVSKSLVGIGSPPSLPAAPFAVRKPITVVGSSEAPIHPSPPIIEGCVLPKATPDQKNGGASNTPAPPTAQSVLATLQKQAAQTTNDQALALIGQQVATIEAAAQTRLTACRANVSANALRLKRLPQHPHLGMNAPERRERAVLLLRSETFLANQKQAQGLVGSASQIFSVIAERRRNEFSARVLQRSPSPFSPEFWSGLEASGRSDLVRLGAATDNAIATFLEAQEPRGALALGGGVLLLLTLLLPGRRVLENWGRRNAIDTAGLGAFARSSHALWLATVDIALPALAGVGLHTAAKWGGLLSEKANAMAGAAVIALIWGAAILALGRALATEKRSDQRLLDLPPSMTGRLKRCLWAVAFVTGMGFLLTRLNYVVGSSVAATIAANAAVSVAYAAVAALILLSLRVDEPAAETGAPSISSQGSAIGTLISIALAAAILAILAAVAFGYTTLAALISGQIFWFSVLAAGAFLLLRFIRELCDALFLNRGWVARTLTRVFGFRRSTIEQIGVLISAVLQLLVLFGAGALALTPFGASGNIFALDFGRLSGSLHIGTATISPVAIATGVISFFLGLAVVQIVRGWFVRRYLPVTDWDLGLRASASTGVTYLGVGLTILCACGAMGLGFQQIALVASALSVGIGFGLQNVVQNFVSGLILLIERPVKVGDWVHVADVEGDIRRIRVRATEIQLFDRSTVIVPNSDLITKSVQNKTLGDPRGRIQLQLSIANPLDALKAKDLITELSKQNSAVLSEPKPAIYVDSLAAGGGVNFNCFLYVANPRDAYRVRSELYFAALSEFQNANISFLGAGGPQTVVIEPGPVLQNIWRPSAGRERPSPTE